MSPTTPHAGVSHTAAETTGTALRYTATASPVARLAYTIPEAAGTLGLGVTSFREYVLPGLRVVRVGTKPIVPRAELEKYLDREARRMLGDELDRDRRSGRGR